MQSFSQRLMSFVGVTILAFLLFPAGMLIGLALLWLAGLYWLAMGLQWLSLWASGFYAGRSQDGESSSRSEPVLTPLKKDKKILTLSSVSLQNTSLSQETNPKV